MQAMPLPHGQWQTVISGCVTRVRQCWQGAGSRPSPSTAHIHSLTHLCAHTEEKAGPHCPKYTFTHSHTCPLTCSHTHTHKGPEQTHCPEGSTGSGMPLHTHLKGRVPGSFHNQVPRHTGIAP